MTGLKVGKGVENRVCFGIKRKKCLCSDISEIYMVLII